MPPTLTDMEPVSDTDRLQTSADPASGEDHNSGDLPDASVLDDKLPEWFRTRPIAALYAGGFGLLFLVLSRIPVFITDVWGHLAYGRLIWNEGFPETAPFLELAEGVRFIDAAWLSQIIGYGFISAWGTAGLQFLFAASVTAAMGLLALMIHRKSASPLAVGVGVVFACWGCWEAIVILRPQTAGLVCFLCLFAMLATHRWSSRFWWAIPVLFAAWANLHGSWLVGLITLGTFFLGRAVDLIRRTGNLKSLLHDRLLRNLFLVTELAAAAVLLNPYGLELYSSVLGFGSQPNLAEMTEWFKWDYGNSTGPAVLATVVGLFVVYRYSPRRVTTAEVFLLLGFGYGLLQHNRMMIWWAPTAAYYLAIHGAAVMREFRRQRKLRSRSTAETDSELLTVRDSEPAEPRSLWTVTTLGICWIAFAFTPIGSKVIHNRDREPGEGLDGRTPILAVEHLKKNPPKGLIYNSMPYGDYLMWAGPENTRIFMGSHVHLIPRDGWNRYLSIKNSNTRHLDRYGIDLVFLNLGIHEGLVKTLRRDDDWRVRFEDDRSIIFVRRGSPDDFQVEAENG